jgi:hypothetical protein
MVGEPELAGASRRTPIPATSSGGRLRALWRSAHEAVPGVPRWARTAAYLVPLTVLPSSMWRIAAVTFHAPLGPLPAGAGTSMPSWFPLEAFVVVLSVGSELLAFTAVGLVARWARSFRAGSPASEVDACRRRPLPSLPPSVPPC